MSRPRFPSARAEHIGLTQTNIGGEKTEATLFSKAVVWLILAAVSFYLFAALLVGLVVMTPIVWEAVTRWVRGLGI